MSKYQVVSYKPKPRQTSDNNNWDEYANETKCVEGIIKVGILNVKSISSRSRPGANWERLKGPGYLRLWQEYARQEYARQKES